MSDKLDKERKKLPKGCIIYKLEIAVNPKEGSVEYIVEGFDETGEAVEMGPIDSNWDYLEDYFDEETLNIFNYLYEVAES
tara:strand:- start:1399 stop:1638 length:240 start_codon:yes stop_codon:yes gene_type:complete